MVQQNVQDNQEHNQIENLSNQKIQELAQDNVLIVEPKIEPVDEIGIVEINDNEIKKLEPEVFYFVD